MKSVGRRIGREQLRLVVAAAVAIGIGGSPVWAVAVVPTDVSYQGVILNDDGTPRLGSVRIEIGIWDQLADGTRLYHEVHDQVALRRGVFQLLLGTGNNPTPPGGFSDLLFEGTNRFIEIAVDGETLAPRQPFSSVAYALRAQQSETATLASDSDRLDGLDSGDFVRGGAVASVTPGMIALGAVTAGNLQSDSVGGAEIVDGAISAQELGVQSVASDKIQNLAVTRPKLANASVANEKIADGAVTLAKIGLDLSQSLVPVGAVLPFAGPPAAVPGGWLLCDGTELLASDFPDLFGVIGRAHGGTISTFRVPDYRGRFLRGVDAGTRRDPDAAGRIKMAQGGNIGDQVGSIQEDATALPKSSFGTTPAGSHGHDTSRAPNHRHNMNNIYISGTSRGNGNGAAFARLGDKDSSPDGAHTHTVSIAPNHSHGVTGGDAETRPRNAAVNWVIRCGPGDAC